MRWHALWWSCLFLALFGVTEGFFWTKNAPHETRNITIERRPNDATANVTTTDVVASNRRGPKQGVLRRAFRRLLVLRKRRHLVIMTIVYYFLSRVLLNLFFQHEKEVAGIEAARQIIANDANGCKVKPMVMSYKSALRYMYRGKRLRDGYYVIINVPSRGGFGGGLIQKPFPYSQPLFNGMCRPATAWQSFTVGQTIHPEHIGTNMFCQGQLIWYIQHGVPMPMSLDVLDRKRIFHTVLWFKHISGWVKLKEYVLVPLLMVIQMALYNKHPTAVTATSLISILLLAFRLPLKATERRVRAFLTKYQGVSDKKEKQKITSESTKRLSIPDIDSQWPKSVHQIIHDV